MTSVSTLFSGSVLSLALLAAVPSFAACDSLEGNWTRSAAADAQVNSGIRWVWKIHGDSLVETVDLTDDWSAAGSGPYFEQETHFDVAVGADCLVHLTSRGSVERSYRIYDEPTADVSEKSVEVAGRVLGARIAGESLVITNAKNASVTFARKR